MKASAVNRCVCAGFEPAGIRCPGKPEVFGATTAPPCNALNPYQKVFQEKTGTNQR